ncbi:MAG: AMP-binding protein [Caldilineaceae bacterium]
MSALLSPLEGRFRTRRSIVDRQLQPVPLGVPGEIYVGGDGVAGGYLHRPELTAERFVRNPFSKADALLYKTGDIGRWHKPMARSSTWAAGSSGQGAASALSWVKSKRNWPNMLRCCQRGAGRAARGCSR